MDLYNTVFCLSKKATKLRSDLWKTALHMGTKPQTRIPLHEDYLPSPPTHQTSDENNPIFLI